MKQWALIAAVSLFGGCGSAAPAAPLPSIEVRSVVAIREAPSVPLDQRFQLVKEIANPCGNFPGSITFGADADLLRVSCLPDPRNASSDGMNGMVGYVHPPRGAPWRVAIDLSTGSELARLAQYATCSDQFDQLELALGRGRAIYHCKISREDSGDSWRIVSADRVEALTLPADYNFNVAPLRDALVRQRTVGRTETGIPNPEVTFPFDGSSSFDWHPLPLPPGFDCVSWAHASDDGKLLHVSAGTNVRRESSGQVSVNCEQTRPLILDPRNGAATALATIPSRGAETSLLASRYRGGAWLADDVLFHELAPDGFDVGFAAGSGLSSSQYRHLRSIAGYGLVGFEATPHVHAGDRQFLYVVFTWSGEPLARFQAQGLAIATDRSRLIVTHGNTLQVWDLR